MSDVEVPSVSEVGDFIEGGGMANPIKGRKDIDDARAEKAKKKKEKAEARARAREKEKIREAEQARAAEANRNRRNTAQGQAATILTGASGLQSESGSARKTLMGA